MNDFQALPPQRPTVGFMVSHPAHWIALGFGSGLASKGPGTAGSLWAWAAWLLIQTHLSVTAQAGVIVSGFLIGWWASTVTAKHLNTSDPGCIVWDEVVAIWLILWLVLPAGFWMQLLAFGLFRFFDIAKPGPVAWADKLFKGFGWRGGFGIMFDDLVAALCTLMVLSLLKWVW